MNFTAEHIGLAARDPGALKDWYVAILGAQIIFESGQSPPAFFLKLPGGLLVEIYKADSATAATSDNKLAGWRHMALQVESLEAARDELAGRGVEFEKEIKPAGGGGRILFFRDGEGNLLHLTERPTHSIFR